MSAQEIYRCQNCNHAGPSERFPEARDVLERIAPGEVFTDRECPACGALAHATSTPRAYHLTSPGRTLRLERGQPGPHDSPPITLDPQHASALQTWLQRHVTRIAREEADTLKRAAFRRAGLPPNLR